MITFEMKDGLAGNTYMLPIDANEGVELTLEREEEPFFRVADDIRVAIVNNDDAMLGSFLSPTGRLRITVRDSGTPIFRGEVARAQDGIRYLPTKEIIHCLIFGDTGALFEQLQGSRTVTAYDAGTGSGRPRTGRGGIRPIYGSSDFVKLEDVLKYQLDRFMFVPPTPRSDAYPLFLGFDLGAFSTRLIRGNTTDNIWGQYGRFSNLDPNATISDLLKAIAVYYNAEFFVDANTQKLTMLERGAMRTMVDDDIDSRISDEVDPEIIPFMQEPFDYVHMIWPKYGTTSTGDVTWIVFEPAYIRFDPSTNAWSHIAEIDYMSDPSLIPRPGGNILDAIPRLQFLDPYDSMKLRPLNGTDIGHFFGAAVNIDSTMAPQYGATVDTNWLERWRWAFFQQRGAEGLFNGTDFRVGDVWRTNGKLGMGSGWAQVKKVTINPITETSKLTVIAFRGQVYHYPNPFE